MRVAQIWKFEDPRFKRGQGEFPEARNQFPEPSGRPVLAARVGIGIGVGIGIENSEGRNGFDPDPDCDPDTEQDPSYGVAAGSCEVVLATEVRT